MFFRFFNTVKHLKPIQFKYLIKHRIKKLLPANKSYNKVESPASVNLTWKKVIQLHSSYINNSTFKFINLEKKFENDLIDWNYSGFGKLWTYNLNYFDYLHQEDLNQNTALDLIFNYINNYENLVDGKEPAPTAIRITNWIKYLSIFKIKDATIDKILWIDTNRLKDNLEFHLLANHLLEDAFGLLFSSYYFQDENIYQLACSILEEQLNEQILNDGAHFELSPMYHQLILFRILDSINLIENNKWIKSDLLSILRIKASSMMGWLEQVKFCNGNLPLVNDSALNVYPSYQELSKYRIALGINPQKQELKECGYRKVTNDTFECFIDVGNIEPSYQPGHAHADTFNFILYADGKPIIIDTGISTYNINDRRLYERSTFAHNTVVVDNKNSSNVWSGFRVAERAKVIYLNESKNKIEASHDGYKFVNAIHTRTWLWNEKSLQINDLINTKDIRTGTAYLHFHADINLIKIDDFNYGGNNFHLSFDNTNFVSIEDFGYATEFNHLHKSKRLCIKFTNRLTTTFLFN